MAPHSSTLAWKIPWAEDPGRLQSMGSLRVGHDWATSLSLFIFMHWRRKWQPLQCSCLENPRDGEAWWAAIYGVAQNQTRLKRLSSSSSSSLLVKERNVLKLRMALGPSSIRCILGSSWHQMIHPRPWNDWLESCRRTDYHTNSFIYID